MVFRHWVEQSLAGFTARGAFSQAVSVTGCTNREVVQCLGQLWFANPNATTHTWVAYPYTKQRLHSATALLIAFFFPVTNVK